MAEQPGGELALARSDDESARLLRFRRMRSLQKFASAHASVTNHFNADRSLSSRAIFKQNRAVALAEWRNLGVA